MSLVIIIIIIIIKAICNAQYPLKKARKCAIRGSYLVTLISHIISRKLYMAPLRRYSVVPHITYNLK